MTDTNKSMDRPVNIAGFFTIVAVEDPETRAYLMRRSKQISDVFLQDDGDDVALVCQLSKICFDAGCGTGAGCDESDQESDDSGYAGSGQGDGGDVDTPSVLIMTRKASRAWYTVSLLVQHLFRHESESSQVHVMCISDDFDGDINPGGEFVQRQSVAEWEYQLRMPSLKAMRSTGELIDPQEVFWDEINDVLDFEMDRPKPSWTPLDCWKHFRQIAMELQKDEEKEKGKSAA